MPVSTQLRSLSMLSLFRTLYDELGLPASVLSDIVMTWLREREHERALSGPAKTRSRFFPPSEVAQCYSNLNSVREDTCSIPGPAVLIAVFPWHSESLQVNHCSRFSQQLAPSLTTYEKLMESVAILQGENIHHVGNVDSARSLQTTNVCYERRVSDVALRGDKTSSLANGLHHGAGSTASGKDMSRVIDIELPSPLLSDVPEIKFLRGQGKREISEKKNPPTNGNGTIPTCENPVTQPRIEPGSPLWEASRLTAQPPQPLQWLNALEILSTRHARSRTPRTNTLLQSINELRDTAYSVLLGATAPKYTFMARVNVSLTGAGGQVTILKAHFGQHICRSYSDHVNMTSRDAEFRTRPRPQERPNVDTGLQKHVAAYKRLLVMISCEDCATHAHRGRERCEGKKTAHNCTKPCPVTECRKFALAQLGREMRTQDPSDIVTNGILRLMYRKTYYPDTAKLGTPKPFLVELCGEGNMEARKIAVRVTTVTLDTGVNEFLALPVDQRREVVLKQKLCFNLLETSPGKEAYFQTKMHEVPETASYLNPLIQSQCPLSGTFTREVAILVCTVDRRTHCPIRKVPYVWETSFTAETIPINTRNAQKHFTPVQSLACSGDEAFDGRVSVALIAFLASEPEAEIALELDL
ncbi:hypothetical protein PR048_023056 [Dryococelus australis]|uniref:Uncharacterized protein n=1 Tax=Dryococelus australis TaxID=614101 RepID=A0ABQ9GSZ6_9NEOP|nr:hypothetical protein PR048_023056 [Dryococelus australis]